MSLARLLREGLRWSIIEKAGLAGFGIARLMVIARFVPTTDIGLLAMANTALAFASILSEMGLGNSLLHHQKVNAPTINTLFWTYTLLGIFLFGVCWAVAPLVALFFGNQEVTWVFQIAAFSLILGGIGQLPSAILYKELAYAKLSRVSLISAIAGFVVVVAFAVAGYGVYALLGGMLFSRLLQTGLLIYWGRTYFAPFGKVQFDQIRLHVQFGAYQTAERLINTFNTKFDILIVGRFLGAEMLGSYELLKRLLERPMRLSNPIVTRLVIPILAQRQQVKSDMGRLYLEQINILCTINFPIYIFMAFSANYVIEILLSEAYVSPINLMVFSLLCVYYMIYTVQNPIGTIIIASGQVRRSFLYNLGIFVVLPAFLLAAAHFGLIGIIVSMTIFHFVMIFVAHYFLLRPAAGIEWKALTKTIIIPLLIGIIMIGLPVGLFITLWPVFWSLVISGVLAAALYVLGIYRWNKAFVYRTDVLIKWRA